MFHSALILHIFFTGGVDSEDPDSIDRQVQGATHQLDKVKARLQALKSLIDFQVKRNFLCH